ncbi:CPBP family intramembrane glutamic endopeptidase [Riemerella columbipharyngis]|uniref:CAAX prenyl protease 2/Lysostaphin resistance protein A-like domain-containing protein n=1 Tax=Riemerella columbipharyngis TaxID=1071918 RepID=A0A1G7ASU6_9FLAO|nr:type II CAAX endopeptidase family protein [Riemerella columbipharyngis]SDE17760.1 hypothetical protein SAMN05421544_10482 [Riemerella columbipharyngis]
MGKYKGKFILNTQGVLIILFTYLVVNLFLTGIGMVVGIEYMQDAYFQAGSYFLLFGLIICSFDYFVVLKETGKHFSPDLKKVPLKTYLLIFPMVIGMMLISDYFVALIPTNKGILKDWYNAMVQAINVLQQKEYILILVTVILAPILEEILFRGIVMKGLINRGINPKSAILMSALAFGITHANPWQSAGAFLMGLALGLVYYKTESIYASILLHSFNNLISVLMMIYSPNSNTYSKLFNIPNWWILAIGVLLFSVFYYLFMHRESSIKQIK